MSNLLMHYLQPIRIGYHAMGRGSQLIGNTQFGCKFPNMWRHWKRHYSDVVVKSYDDRSDYVFIEILTFHGYHGDLKEEKVLGQKWQMDIKLYPKCRQFVECGKSDRLSDTFDYTVIIKEIETMMQSTSYDMMEKLGNEIARTAFQLYGFDKLDAVNVQIRKPHVPITQIVKCVGVNIFRTSDQFQ